MPGTGHRGNMMITNGNGNKIPIEAQFLYRKALEMSGQGRHEPALNCLKQVIMIAPCFTKAFCEMGKCLYHLGRYREAVIKYDKALEIDPSNQDAYRNKAMVLEEITQRGTGGEKKSPYG
jgi:tetratricopeptide (TPR) repeat protein